MAILAFRLVVTFTAVVMLACGMARPAEAFAGKEPVKLTPHRAVYEMTLDEARSASGITGIDGRMVFEFTGSECDGYTLNMRMVTQMTDSQGQTNLTDLPRSRCPGEAQPTEPCGTQPFGQGAISYAAQLRADECGARGRIAAAGGNL